MRSLASGDGVMMLSNRDGRR